MNIASGPVTPTPPPLRLNGWKEIAAHLGKGVRTVQRWEKTLELPVHRLGTGRGEVVYAVVTELDAWLAAAERTTDLTETPGERDPGEEAEAGTLPSAPSAPSLDGADSGAAKSPAEGPSTPLRHRPGAFPAARRLGTLALSLAVVLAASVAFLAWHRSHGGIPSDWRMDVDTLRVFDARGRELWSHRFETACQSALYNDATRNSGSGLVQIDDFDGDGRREVVVGLVAQQFRRPSQLLAFDDTGRALFADKPERPVRFGRQEYAPPWIAYHTFVTQSARTRSLWVSWIHAGGNFPCLLQRRALSGRVTAEYWSAGYVEFVGAAAIGGVPSILVGASNNDHKGASLAVFDEDRVGGSAPAENDDKRCYSCPPGGPRAFLVFPALDLKRMIGGIPSVVGVRQQTTGDLRVLVEQRGRDAAEFPLDGGVLYDLAPDLTPHHAELGAEFVASHRRLERSGLLDHPLGQRDLDEAWPVLVWDGQRFAPVVGKTDR